MRRPHNPHRFVSLGVAIAAALPIALFVATAGAAPQYASAPANARIVRCESDNGGQRLCTVDVQGSVRLQRQLSDARCIEGRTWGYDGRSIWVTQGCRAEFAILPGYGYGQPAYGNPPYGSPYVGNSGQTVRCESSDGRWAHCAMDARGDIQLVRQLSDSNCIQGRDWDRDQGGVWVTRGCRAEFRSTGYNGYGYNAAAGSQTLRCESNDGRYHQCTADVRGGARLLRQLSDAQCIEGRTWGTDRNGLWVDRGCRADFQTVIRGNGDWSWGGSRNGGYAQPGYPGNARTLRCESSDGRTHRCDASIAGGARLVRQLSDTRCVQGYSWGWDRGGVWVSGGCRADFETW